MQQKLKKFDIKSYHKIMQEIELEDSFATEIKKTKSDAETLSLLIHAKQHTAAIKFLALGLPKREAIWWGYLCSYDVESSSTELNTQNALSTISAWVHQPSEHLRWQAKSLANYLDQYTATSWACMSVFWSGGSISPKDKPAVEPVEFMCHHAVSNAITMAAKSQNDATNSFQHHLKMGLHIVMGGNGKI